MSDWHDEYDKLYKKAKERGVPFFPYAVVKDVLMAVFILGLLSFLAIKFGAGLEDLADPTDTTYNPRPEWYFLFLFQALKAFPGSLEPIAAVVLPGAGVLVLLLLPFLDAGRKRHPLDRPFWTGVGIFSLLVIGALTYAGLTSPMVNPIVEKDPVVGRGKRLYTDLNCVYCHQIGGKGGNIGPVLDQGASEESVEWLKKHFRDPRSVTPGSVMPKLNLLDDEIDALSAYIKTLDSSAPFTKEAPKLFAEHCAACHRVGKEGSEVGPDLSFIGSARDRGFLKRYITDPSVYNQTSQMPGFKGQLTDVQIEDVARYLSSLR